MLFSFLEEPRTIRKERCLQKVVILLGFENEEKETVVKHVKTAALYFLAEPSRTRFIVLVADNKELQDFMEGLLLKWGIPKENIRMSVVFGDGWKKMDKALQLLEKELGEHGTKYWRGFVVIHQDHDIYRKEKQPCSA